MRMERETRSHSFFVCERAYPRYLRSSKHNYYFHLRRKSCSYDRGTHWPTKMSHKRHSNLRLINATKPINFPPSVMCKRGGKRASLSAPGPPNRQQAARDTTMLPPERFKMKNTYLTLPGKAQIEHRSNSEKLWALSYHAHIRIWHS
jgi:hypothetical protein